MGTWTFSHDACAILPFLDAWPTAQLDTSRVLLSASLKAKELHQPVNERWQGEGAMTAMTKWQSHPHEPPAPAYFLIAASSMMFSAALTAFPELHSHWLANRGQETGLRNCGNAVEIKDRE